MSSTTPVDKPASDGSRYPKRKRNIVTYADQDISADEESDQEEPRLKKPSRNRKSAPKTRQQAPFPFMLLPPEIRNRIYEETLVDPNDLHIRSYQGRYRRKPKHCAPANCQSQYSRGIRRRWQWQQQQDSMKGEEGEEMETSKKYPLVPALLATCKQIYAEAAPILYGQCITVSDTYTLQTFLLQIGPRATSLLQDLEINGWCTSRSHKAINLPAFALLRDATSLRRLHIASPFTYYRYSWHHGINITKDEAKTKQGVLAARRLYRAMYPFLEALVRTKGKSAAMEVLSVVSHDEANFNEPTYDVAKTIRKAMTNELQALLEKNA